ncbi:hypothetical protein LZ30DRAFT_3999 [Colletotrichum cereale]|nr:hypothetical protein LZ30DRAFT_3999 [Colletotrichum cereale]
MFYLPVLFAGQTAVAAAKMTTFSPKGGWPTRLGGRGLSGWIPDQNQQRSLPHWRFRKSDGRDGIGGGGTLSILRQGCPPTGNTTFDPFKRQVGTKTDNFPPPSSKRQRPSWAGQRANEGGDSYGRDSNPVLPPPKRIHFAISLWLVERGRSAIGAGMCLSGVL